MSSLSDFVGGSPQVWVSGTTYAAGKVVWSPTDYQYFMRKSTGGGTTDPASDPTNWQPTGERAIKSIQRGRITIAAASSATATIAAVVTAKTLVSLLGFSTNGVTDVTAAADVVLTNTTTITATRGGSTGTSYVSWEAVERY